MINKYSTLICLVFIFSACVANKTQINTYNINSEYEVKQQNTQQNISFSMNSIYIKSLTSFASKHNFKTNVSLLLYCTKFV